MLQRKRVIFIYMNVSYEKHRIDKMEKSFWTLNNEMSPRYKVSFVREIDATSMEQIREQATRSGKPKPSYTALISRAVALVMDAYPYANRRIFSVLGFKKMVQFKSSDIAVAIERNLPDKESVVMVDVIRNADQKSLEQLNDELQKLSNANLENNRQWKVFYNLLNRLPVFLSRFIIGAPAFFPKAWSQYRGAAFFVNSPAKYGIDLVIGDFLWPVTISYGYVRERPYVINGKVEVRKTVPLIMVFDRRVMAGAPAAKMFTQLAELIQHAKEKL